MTYFSKLKLLFIPVLIFSSNVYANCNVKIYVHNEAPSKVKITKLQFKFKNSSWETIWNGNQTLGANSGTGGGMWKEDTFVFQSCKKGHRARIRWKCVGDADGYRSDKSDNSNSDETAKTGIRAKIDSCDKVTFTKNWNLGA